ncbi:hypothetical protein HUJ04_001760 [Dendroctonus ponderosae]
MIKLARVGLLVSIFVLANCDNSDKISYEEAKLSNYLKELEETPAVSLVGDYVVLQKKEGRANQEESDLSEDLLSRCARFLASRELVINMPESEGRDLFSGSRSKKIRRILLPLLLLLKLKAAIILPIVLSAIALLSLKGFGLSLAALAVAGTTALKNLLEHAGSKVSYEVVPTPVGHWSRSGALDDSLVNAYEYQAI